jgi:hypothetical protein
MLFTNIQDTWPRMTEVFHPIKRTIFGQGSIEIIDARSSYDYRRVTRTSKFRLSRLSRPLKVASDIVNT